MERGHITLELSHSYRNHDYSPIGGKEGDVGSTTGGNIADDIARHQEHVETAGKKGKAARQRRAAETDSDAVDMQVLKDERVAAEKGLERAERELKKARDLLAERTAELKSAKQSLTTSNRARNEGDKEVHYLQKQVALLRKQMDLEKKQSGETVKAYNKVKETTRAKIAELEEEIAQNAPFLHDLEGRVDTLKDWSDRDRLLRKGYLRLKKTQPGEGGQAEKLHAAEEVLGILEQYLEGPRIEEQPSGSIGGPMDEEEGDQGEGEEATGLGGDTPDPDASTLPGEEKKIKKRKNIVEEIQSGRSSKKGRTVNIVTQMRPNKETYGRLRHGLHPPTTKPKRATKRQRQEAARSDDDDPYCTTGTTEDPFGDNNADATRLQSEADARARDSEVKNRGLDQETGPKTRSSTSSSTAASSTPPSPAISLVETPQDSPVELASYAGVGHSPSKTTPREMTVTGGR